LGFLVDAGWRGGGRGATRAFRMMGLSAPRSSGRRVTVLIAIPGQAYRALGIELVVLAVIAGTGFHVLDRRAKCEQSTQAIGPALEAVTPTTITSALLLAAGIVLVLGVHAGLYVLVGPVFVALAGGLTSAWLFLTKITE
jgi:hypothetical protein